MVRSLTGSEDVGSIVQPLVRFPPASHQVEGLAVIVVWVSHQHAICTNKAGTSPYMGHISVVISSAGRLYSGDPRAVVGVENMKAGLPVWPWKHLVHMSRRYPLLYVLGNGVLRHELS